MAQEHTATFSNKPVSARQKEKEFEAHMRTYHAVMKGTKWSLIGIGVILIALYFVFVH